MPSADCRNVVNHIDIVNQKPTDKVLRLRMLAIAAARVKGLPQPRGVLVWQTGKFSTLGDDLSAPRCLSKREADAPVTAAGNGGRILAITSAAPRDSPAAPGRVLPGARLWCGSFGSRARCDRPVLQRFNNTNSARGENIPASRAGAALFLVGGAGGPDWLVRIVFRPGVRPDDWPVAGGGPGFRWASAPPGRAWHRGGTGAPPAWRRRPPPTGETVA